MNSGSQIPLFDQNQSWESEWQDMPEFVQEKKDPYSKIIVRFETEKDLTDFALLTNLIP